MVDLAKSDLPEEERTPEIRLAQLSRPVSWSQVFGNEHPVHLEIGSGSGHWTAEFAKINPDINLMSIEKFNKQVRRVIDKVRRRDLENVRVLRCDGSYFVAEYVPSESLDGIHVYFPDPWFKNRHAKRRLIQPDAATHLLRTLKPGCSLHIKTDITSYHEQVLEVLGAIDGFLKVEERRLDEEYPRDENGNLPLIEHIQFKSLPPLLRLTTNYERKALAAGHPIHYTRWVKTD